MGDVKVVRSSRIPHKHLTHLFPDQTKRFEEILFVVAVVVVVVVVVVFYKVDAKV